MSYSSALNPNVVKTALDNVFMQEWNVATHPGYGTARSSKAFSQDSTDRAAEIEEVYGGVDLFEETAEEQTLPEDDPRITNEIVFNVIKYAKRVPIPDEFFKDNMHGSYEKMVRGTEHA